MLSRGLWVWVTEAMPNNGVAAKPPSTVAARDPLLEEAGASLLHHNRRQRSHP